MFRLIYNTILIVVVTGLVSLSIVGIIKAINLMVQWVAKQLGYEVGDFLQWVKSIIPRRNRYVWVVITSDGILLGVYKKEKDADSIVKLHATKSRPVMALRSQVQ